MGRRKRVKGKFSGGGEEKRDFGGGDLGKRVGINARGPTLEATRPRGKPMVK